MPTERYFNGLTVQMSAPPLQILTRNLDRKMRASNPGPQVPGAACTMETIWLQRPSATVPWGFRLQGGSDFGLPLTVQRVTAGSVAAGGLGQGDVILKIGNIMATELSHMESQKLIKRAGKTLQLTIEKSSLTGSTSSLPRGVGYTAGVHDPRGSYSGQMMSTSGPQLMASPTAIYDSRQEQPVEELILRSPSSGFPGPGSVSLPVSPRDSFTAQLDPQLSARGIRSVQPPVRAAFLPQSPRDSAGRGECSGTSSPVSASCPTPSSSSSSSSYTAGHTWIPSTTGYTWTPPTTGHTWRPPTEEHTWTPTTGHTWTPTAEYTRTPTTGHNRTAPMAGHTWSPSRPNGVPTSPRWMDDVDGEMGRLKLSSPPAFFPQPAPVTVTPVPPTPPPLPSSHVTSPTWRTTSAQSQPRPRETNECEGLRIPDKLLATMSKAGESKTPFSYGLELDQLKQKLGTRSTVPSSTHWQKQESTVGTREPANNGAMNHCQASAGLVQSDMRLKAQEEPRSQIDKSPINVHIEGKPKQQSMSFKVLQQMTSTDSTPDKPDGGSPACRRGPRDPTVHNAEDDEMRFSGLNHEAEVFNSFRQLEKMRAQGTQNQSAVLEPSHRLHLQEDKSQGVKEKEGHQRLGADIEETPLRYTGKHIPSPTFRVLQSWAEADPMNPVLEPSHRPHLQENRGQGVKEGHQRLGADIEETPLRYTGKHIPSPTFRVLQSWAEADPGPTHYQANGVIKLNGVGGGSTQRPDATDF